MIINNDLFTVAGERHFPLHGLPGSDQRRPSAVQILPTDHLQKPRLQQPLPLPPRHTQVQVRRLPEGNYDRVFVYRCINRKRVSDDSLSLEVSDSV